MALLFLILLKKKRKKKEEPENAKLSNSEKKENLHIKKKKLEGKIGFRFRLTFHKYYIEEYL